MLSKHWRWAAYEASFRPGLMLDVVSAKPSPRRDFDDGEHIAHILLCPKSREPHKCAFAGLSPMMLSLNSFAG